MYHVSAQGVDERMINVHYYYTSRLLASSVTSGRAAMLWSSFPGKVHRVHLDKVHRVHLLFGACQ